MNTSLLISSVNCTNMINGVQNCTISGFASLTSNIMTTYGTCTISNTNITTIPTTTTTTTTTTATQYLNPVIQIILSSLNSSLSYSQMAYLGNNTQVCYFQ